MERYEAYKDSGIEWIGEIPEGWGLLRVKNVVAIGNGSDPKTEGSVPVYGSGEQATKTCGEFKQGRAVLLGRKGSIDRPKYVEGPYWNVDTAFDCKSDLMPLKLFYYLATCFDYARYSTSTTVPSMTSSQYENMTIPMPSELEQQVIADFLDEKTAEIDGIVSETERSIELLREYRKSVISEAVTKGLDPDAPMKDSGVEWIGEIPVDWKMQRAKYSVSSFRKGSGITKEEVSADGDIFCVRYGEIYSKYAEKVVDIKSKTFEKAIAAPQYLEKGCLLFACTGELVEEIGKNVLFDSDSPCLAGGDIIVAEHEQHAGFLNYSLGSYIAQCQKSYGKAKLKVVHISAGELGNVRMPLPSLQEQREIADYLDAKTAEIDALIAGKEKQVELLKEYRKSLISEAVTGKFKVPGVK